MADSLTYIGVGLLCELLGLVCVCCRQQILALLFGLGGFAVIIATIMTLPVGALF